MINSKDTKTYT